MRRFRVSTVSAAYTGELGTEAFLRYKRKSAISGNPHYFMCKARQGNMGLTT